MRRGPFTVLALASLCTLCACAPPTADERFARAAAAFADGDHRVAAIELRNVLQANPDHRDARLLLGRSSFALGDLEGAVRELTRARELGAAPEEFASVLAEALAGVGRIEESLAELETLPEAARNADWFDARGRITARSGDAGAAEAAFRRALELDPAHYSSMLGIARIAAGRQDWDAALAQASRALELQPDRPQAYFVRGVVELESGNVGAAEDDLERSVERWAIGAPSEEERAAVFVLAQVQLALRRADGLTASAARARERMPGAAVTSYVEGAADFANGRYSDANPKLQRAAVGAPGNPQVALLLGANNLALGNLSQAEQHLAAVVNARSADPMAVRLLAETRRRQGRPADALRGFERLPDIDSDTSLVALRGMLYMEAGQPDRGVALLEQALQGLPGDAGLRLQLARAYIAAGRADDAAQLFVGILGADTQRAVETAVGLIDGAAAGADPRQRAEDAIAAAPADAQTLLGAGLFLHAAGERDQALVLFRRAAETDSAFVAPTLVMAGLALTDGETERARGLYAEASTRAPSDFRAWLGLSQVAAIDGAADEALRYARRAAEADPRAVAPELFVGRLALAQRDVEGAQAAARAALRIDARNADANTLAAELALLQGDSTRALESFERARAAEPRRADRWYNLGRAQRVAGDLPAAQASLREAVALQPRGVAPRVELARVEQALGNVDAARRLAKSVQADYPDNPEGALLEAIILAAEQDYAGAARLFDQAYGERPSFETALAAYNVRRAGGIAEPAAPLQRWLEASPNDARAWTLLAESHQSDGRAEQALAAYERALATQPNNVVALNNAAWLLNEAGDARAVDYARRAYELVPSAPGIADTYAWTLLQRRAGTAEQAAALLREAVRNSPNAAPDIEYHLAYALVEVGEPSEARTVLRRLLDRDEEFSSREDAQALLGRL